MPTILVLDDDPIHTALITQVAAEGDHTVQTSRNLEDFSRRLREEQIDLAMISLATVSDKDIPHLQHMFLETPDIKILAVAPNHGGDGLATLLRAESLQAQHLLASPIDSQQLLSVLNLTFPQPTQQE